MALHCVQPNEYIIVSLLNALRNAKLKRGQVVGIARRVTMWLEQQRWHGSAYAAMLSFSAEHPEVGTGLVKSIWTAAQQVPALTVLQWHDGELGQQRKCL